MGTASQKLTYLNDTKTKIRDRINSLGGSLDSDDTFRSYADELESLYNEMPKVSDTGTDLTLENTRKGAMSITYKGDTQQDSTPTPSSPQPIHNVSGDNTIEICGKNLFDKGAVTSNRIIKRDDGTLEQNNGYKTSDYIPVKANVAYTQTNFNHYYSVYYDTNKNYVGVCGSATFTPSQDGYIRTSTQNANIDTAMVEVGSTATAYEAYTGQSQLISLGVENLAKYDTNDYTSSSLSSLGAFNITLDNSFNVKNGEEYYFSAYVKLNSGSATTLQTLRCGDVGGGGQTTNFISNPTLASDYQRYISKVVFTQDLTLNKMAFQVASQANNAVLEVKNIMISKEPSANYYAYGTTPLELNKIGNYQDFIRKGTGKNLFDSTQELSQGQYTSGVWGENNNRITSDYISIKENKTYTIYCDLTNAQDVALINYNLFDKDKTWLGARSENGDTAFSGDKTHTFKVNLANAKYVRITFRRYSSDSTTLTATRVADSIIQFEESNQATLFEPYGFKDKWYLHKEIHKEKPTISTGSLEGNGCRLSPNLSQTPISGYCELYCTHFKRAKNYNEAISAGNAYPNYLGLNASGQILCNSPNFSSVSDYRDLFNNNDIYIYYPLATPTDTEITDTTLLEQLETIKRSYDGVTNISQENNDLPFILDVSALKEWE